MTDEEMRDLVKECGLDWQKGYMPLFAGDPTNRYAVLIEAVAEKAAADEREKLARFIESCPANWPVNHADLAAAIRKRGEPQGKEE